MKSTIIIPSSSPNLLLLIITVIVFHTTTCSSSPADQHLLNGFKATPDPSVSSFHSLLNDSTTTFSFGFLRLNRTQLTLAVLHLPSYEPLWVSNPTGRLPSWSPHTQLSFNRTLIMSDHTGRVFWSTHTEGDRVVLLNDSNLQIQQSLDAGIVWESFQFPTNTLVENQNFTSVMTLVSSNQLYSMKLGTNFWGLYAKFKQNSNNQIYFKHKALEAKAAIVKGKGPIYVRVNSAGFLGTYQNENAPVDVQPFNSFQRTTGGILILRLEPDGNFKGYYWDGSNWILNYQAITDTCELPSPCGPYSLCSTVSGCSCLDNRTEYNAGECVAAGPESGDDFCSNQVLKKNEFRVLRREGVELPFKEMMGYVTASSFEECEGICAKNCSCWGAMYNNASGFCYLVDYPIQSLVGVGDVGKLGYFKVRKGIGEKKIGTSVGIVMGILGGVVLFLIVFIVVGYGSYKIWRRKRVERILAEEGGVSPGPYKDLSSASFRSIEMCDR